VERKGTDRMNMTAMNTNKKQTLKRKMRTMNDGWKGRERERGNIQTPTNTHSPRTQNSTTNTNWNQERGRRREQQVNKKKMSECIATRFVEHLRLNTQSVPSQVHTHRTNNRREDGGGNRGNPQHTVDWRTHTRKNKHIHTQHPVVKKMTDLRCMTCAYYTRGKKTELKRIVARVK